MINKSNFVRSFEPILQKMVLNKTMVSNADASIAIFIARISIHSYHNLNKIVNIRLLTYLIFTITYFI